MSLKTALRTHSCGELRMADVGQVVTLCGWVQKSRDMNHFVFVDMRDRYGITQVICNNRGDEGTENEKKNYAMAQKLGRESVIKVTGKVTERSNKNAKRPTGDIEIIVDTLEVLTEAKTPPFLIEDKTDANEDTRLQFRYLDIRRNPVKNSLILRHKIAMSVRKYLSSQEFIEVETPVLIKSTPEGARDFVVPSRMNPGTFYALPQSPQTFKQLLMVAGMDRYFQIVKCFRDEELRADRQPEFTQIDCEMSFVTQDDVLDLFEEMMRVIFKDVINIEFPKFEKMTFKVAMDEYGSDKPDLRFGMKLGEVTDLAQGKGLPFFDSAEYIGAIAVPGLGSWSTKKIKALEKKAKSSVCGAKNLVWAQLKCLDDGKLSVKSSVDKLYKPEDIAAWAQRCGGKSGDLLLVSAGKRIATQNALGKLRNEMGDELGLRKGFSAHWVVDFPMFEYDEDNERWTAMHHPFTSPHPDDMHLLDSNPGECRAYAYDMVINGVEVGGGSIRIHNKELQAKVFQLLGFTQESAHEQFGFLMDAFEYGAPPHGGLAFGLDRICTILGGAQSIRDFIAFPKNNQGRDMMINSPAPIAKEQMEELFINSTYSAAKQEGADEQKE